MNNLIYKLGINMLYNMWKKFDKYVYFNINKGLNILEIYGTSQFIWKIEIKIHKFIKCTDILIEFYIIKYMLYNGVGYV